MDQQNVIPEGPFHICPECQQKTLRIWIELKPHPRYTNIPQQWRHIECTGCGYKPPLELVGTTFDGGDRPQNT
jgi:hypothetical protein